MEFIFSLLIGLAIGTFAKRSGLNGRIYGGITASLLLGGSSAIGFYRIAAYVDPSIWWIYAFVLVIIVCLLISGKRDKLQSDLSTSSNMLKKNSGESLSEFFCNQCGSKQVSSALFCSRCGHKVN